MKSDVFHKNCSIKSAEAVSAPERLGDLALKMFGPNRGVDLELPEHSLHEPVELSE